MTSGPLGLRWESVIDALRALPTPYALDCVLHGGDDYELLWCAPPSLRDAVRVEGSSLPSTKGVL